MANEFGAAVPAEVVADSVTDSVADFVIVGGGLAGGLVALAKTEAFGGERLMLIEQEVRLGGNHIWSFHRTDLEADGWKLVAPLLEHRWPRHEVRFPGYARTIEGEYASVTSARFARVVGARLAAAGARVAVGRAVAEVEADRVRLADGTEIRARVVIDARGPARASGAGRAGFQKFVGLELELEEDGPWQAPVVMDAAEDVTQEDGFRFVYVLPFSRRHVLVEDTVYADGPGLDAAAVGARALAYAAARGARVRRILRREIGVLPLPLGGGDGADNLPASALYARGPLRIGYRGGFFHPVTGYSLPIAIRVALALAPAGTRAEAAAALGAVADELAPQQRFGQRLNRLMFEAMPPALRWTALERFYRMRPDTIARFYASRTTLWDRARLLAGRPPRGNSWRRLLALPGGAS